MPVSQRTSDGKCTRQGAWEEAGVCPETASSPSNRCQEFVGCFFFNNNIKSHSGPSYHSFLPPFEGRRSTQLQLSHTKISGKFILMQQDRQAEAFTLNSFVAGNLPSVPPPALLHTTFPFLFYEWSRFCITLLQQALWQHLRSSSTSPASLLPC